MISKNVADASHHISEVIHVVELANERIQGARNGEVQVMEAPGEVDGGLAVFEMKMLELSAPEIVDHRHVVLFRDEPLHEIGANHSSSAGHQNAAGRKTHCVPAFATGP